MYLSTLIKRNKKLDIKFEQLVFECASYYMLVEQWLENNNLDSAFEYKCKADCLLEILEVIVCGSVGGFDGGQFSSELGRVNRRKYTHDFDRLLWIWDNYTDFNYVKKYREYIEELKKYFSRKRK